MIKKEDLTDEKLELLSAEELTAIVKTLRNFFPPVSPIVGVVKGVVLHPVRRDSSVEMRLLVEHFAKCFQQEATFMYGLPNIGLQFDAFGDKEFEAWIALDIDDTTERVSTNIGGKFFTGDSSNWESVMEKENLVDLRKAVGCCLFYKDDGGRLNADQKSKSEWIAAWAWTHPDHRRKGALKFFMKDFEKYGEYWIEGPLSEDMKAIMDKYRIEAARILLKETENLENL